MSEGQYDAAQQEFINSFSDEVEPNQPEPAQGGEVEPSQPVDPASREIDISGLPEEAQVFIRAREREMQADYTRKTQEIAEQRREAEQAMQFLTALNSDPDFAFQVLNHLQSNLAQAGYGVAPQEYDQYGQYEGDEYGIEADGPDPVSQELAELAWRQEQMESQWLEANLSAQIDRQLASIQSQHPDWSDDDIQSVIDYGFATGGDLFKAAELHQANTDRVLARYLERKGSVNTPAPLPNAPAQAAPHQPQDEKELHAAAREYVMRQLQG